FQIKFNVWRKIVIPNPKSKSKQKNRKRSHGTKSAKSTYQWKKYQPTCDVKKILRVSSFGWPIFRRKLLECCDSAKKGISKDLLAADRRGNLTIMGWINGSENHKKNDEAVLNDSTSYKLFMEVARRAPVNTKMGFKIIHPNPKDNGESSTPEEEDERSSLEKDDQSNEESDDEDPIDAKLQILMTKFSKSFKAGENVAVFPNPKKSGEIMVLTTRRLRQWAGDWADGKRGVDEVNPPSNRGWRFVPVADYDKERLRMIQMEDGTDESSVNQPVRPPANVSGSPGININLFGPGPMPRPLSPAGRPYPDFEDFLIFAKIRPHMTQVREALEREGIIDFERLLDRDLYSVDRLRSFGIPFAQAADIWKAVPDFNDWVKKN
ncbi:hypothetical protein DFH28DRAFT_879267, partial [Melampsora americana]